MIGITIENISLLCFLTMIFNTDAGIIVNQLNLNQNETKNGIVTNTITESRILNRLFSKSIETTDNDNPTLTIILTTAMLDAIVNHEIAEMTHTIKNTECGITMTPTITEIVIYGTLLL